MKNLILFVLILSIAYCVGNAQEHHHKHSANEYMHQSSIEELAERFESPERDAYQMPDNVLEYLGPIQDKTIMDIGAGSGYFSVKLAKQGAKVIAADVNKEFQEYLQKRNKKENISNITLRLIPYDEPSLQKQEVDMVLLVNTYHHIEHRPNYFAKVKQGVKPNGSLIIIDYAKTDIPVGPPMEHKIGMDEIIAELKQAGFSRFDINVNLLPYQFIIKAE